MPTQTQLPPYHWHKFHPNAALHYVRDLRIANTLLDDLRGPVGFDLEWRPTFTKNTPENPVAIVQLANASMILVIQVSEMSEFPLKLKDLLENPDIVKAGVGIQNDAKKLYRDWQVSVQNCVDLSLLARCADNAQWKGKYSTPLGLARLVEAYESLTLPKGKVSRSNWEGLLTSLQVDYAGNDAHAGFLIYQRLSVMANAMDKVPKPVYYSFNLVRGSLCEPGGMQWNCHNPDYDPGPPPPPKPPKPPTTRDVRRANLRYLNSRVAARLGGTPGATSESDSVPNSQRSSTSSLASRSIQIDRVRRFIHTRASSAPDSNSGDATSSSPMSSSLSQVQSLHSSSEEPPLLHQKSETSQRHEPATTSKPRRRRHRPRKSE